MTTINRRNVSTSGVFSASVALFAGLGMTGLFGKAAVAAPQVTLTLGPASVMTPPGQNLSISALVTNLTGVSLSLSGFNGSITNNSTMGTASGISWGDTAFTNSLPDPLTATGTNSTYAGTLFLNVGAMAQAGFYTADYSVTYTNTSTNIDYVGEGIVNLQVQASAPEPAAVTLLLPVLPIVLTGACEAFRRRRLNS